MATISSPSMADLRGTVLPSNDAALNLSCVSRVPAAIVVPPSLARCGKTWGKTERKSETKAQILELMLYKEGEISGNSQGHVVGTPYAHNQKSILVDTPASEATRRITAFLGGLDLAAGRYDTPAHRLFGDLDTVFRGDIHNPTLGDAAGENGPRLPWHDMHCRLDGAAAYDVLKNFEQRWRRATAKHLKASKHGKDDALLKLQRIPWILSPVVADGEDDALRVLPEDDPRCWHAQVFRSVDAGSVKGFPRSWETEEMEARHLLCDKSLAVEQSIHAAYVAAIRAADRFVYLETERFLGSSYAWPAPFRHPGAGNLVPMEIALKAASKIRAGEDFAAYVVHRYRMSLWEEHLGGLAEVLKAPESPECVRLVNQVARENWDRYTDEGEVVETMQGHLMKYPVEVDHDGSVWPLTGHEFFPDVGGRVLGSTNKFPDHLTM
ncbi:unnamed protein product [Triticum turgidum subsp. durum]|uniref:Phospholipase D C-terminal domain-containing protein n=1 Tax=Triticum turgidum subsp. durum TaxID=4567 RepID=A0A9R0XTU3_TRITD|nr:unnamed protein product [Triticum turgidum subsp. durum]